MSENVFNNSSKKINSHKKPKDNKVFIYDDANEEIEASKNLDPFATDLEIEKMHVQLEKLRQTKKDLENENENLDCKINDLKKIIKRIQDEDY